MGIFTNILSLCALCALLLCEALPQPSPKNSHPIPTFFGRRHPNGTIVDASSPEYNEINNGPWINTIHTNDEQTIKLEAWPKVVANGGQVIVLWQGEQGMITLETCKIFFQKCYLIGQNFGGQKFRRIKISADKNFRWTKFSAASQIFGSFVRR